MELIQRHADAMYLQCDKYVNYDDPAVADKAAELARGTRTPYERIQKCYYFVRDEIANTIDANDSTVTVTASEVLDHRTGISYSKANLLAALLRANNIYCGFCYQRIKIFESGSKLSLHALVAAFEPDLGRWIRMDARGNNYHFNADLSPAESQLGYTIREELGEFEFEDVLATPLPSTIYCLEKNTNAIKMYYNDLPDYDD